MIFLILLILVGAAFKWGFKPYFVWRSLATTPFSGTINVLTKDKKVSLQDYIRSLDPNKRKYEYSLVIPAYKEEKRLHNMLPSAIRHFEKMKYNYEIIIVNDASTDKTVETALSYCQFEGKNIDLKVVDCSFNQGKGGAIRTGMIPADGEIILMIDADGASEISEFEKFVLKLKSISRDGEGLVAGSRNHDEDELIRGRFGYRMFLSLCSNFIVQTICGVKLRDTQCGFKIFTYSSAKKIFKALHIRRWAFDVELFVIANYSDIPYCEMGISYTDQEGSKLNIVTDTIQMARDYILIRLFYVLRLWRRNDSDKIWDNFLTTQSEERSKSPKRPKRE